MARFYAAFGVQSPYLPSLLDSHGLPSEAIALVLAAGKGPREQNGDIDRIIACHGSGSTDPTAGSYG